VIVGSTALNLAKREVIDHAHIPLLRPGLRLQISAKKATDQVCDHADRSNGICPLQLRARLRRVR